MKNFVLIAFILGIALPQTRAVAAPAELSRFEERCLLLRDAQQQIVADEKKYQNNDAVRRRKFVAELLRSKPLPTFTADELGVNSARYFVARLEAMAGNDNKALKELAALAGQATVAPEAIFNFFEISSFQDKKSERLCDALLGSLLPVSVFGLLTDDRKAKSKILNGRRPVIPAPNEYRMPKVAELLFQMKMYDRASIACIEAAYSTNAPSWIRQWYSESWLSTSSAPLWLTAAQSQWYLGHTADAADYLAKAIIYGSDPTKDEALKVLKEWEIDPSPKTPDAQPDATKIKQIAEHYAYMNMLPRSIELVKEFEPILGDDAKPLRELYERVWLERVAHYCVGTTKGQCFLFGQNVSRPEDRLKVVIPPPMRPEALAEAVETVRKFQTP